MRAEGITRDDPTCFRLPPMIDDRNLQFLFCPLQGVRIRTLPSQEQSPEMRQVVLAEMLALRILAFDGTEGRRGGK
ncbi:hypothetical protein D3C87_1748070 [compost metagenome]